MDLPPELRPFPGLRTSALSRLGSCAGSRAPRHTARYHPVAGEIFGAHGDPVGRRKPAGRAALELLVTFAPSRVRSDGPAPGWIHRPVRGHLLRRPDSPRPVSCQKRSSCPCTPRTDPGSSTIPGMAKRKNPYAVALGKRGGKVGGPKGGKARMAALSATERSALARKRGAALWKRTLKRGGAA